LFHFVSFCFIFVSFGFILQKYQQYAKEELSRCWMYRGDKKKDVDEYFTLMADTGWRLDAVRKPIKGGADLEVCDTNLLTHLRRVWSLFANQATRVPHLLSLFVNCVQACVTQGMRGVTLTSQPRGV
jgi:hypothetical protein